MVEYALVGPADEIKTFSRDIRPDVGTKPGWRWLPVERTEDPHDPAAEVLEPESVKITKDRVAVTRAVRAKTVEELDQERAAEIETALPPALIAVLTELDGRIRALEQKAPRTPAEFKETVLELFR
jgi:hypothetical protein